MIGDHELLTNEADVEELLFQSGSVGSNWDPPNTTISMTLNGISAHSRRVRSNRVAAASVVIVSSLAVVLAAPTWFGSHKSRPHQATRPQVAALPTHRLKSVTAHRSTIEARSSNAAAPARHIAAALQGNSRSHSMRKSSPAKVHFVPKAIWSTSYVFSRQQGMVIPFSERDQDGAEIDGSTHSAAVVPLASGVSYVDCGCR